MKVPSKKQISALYFYSWKLSANEYLQKFYRQACAVDGTNDNTPFQQEHFGLNLLLYPA
jgi:hypothetical protein